MSFSEPLLENDVDPDPVVQFRAWFHRAAEAGVRLPEAVAVATASSDGAPSARMVLLKQADHDGFVFFTNYESRKGRELSSNPRAAMLFYWDQLGRQVRIEGPVTRVSAEESASYIGTRPRASQLSALASPQSKPVDSRRALQERVDELAARYGESELPVPDNWGGFRLVPESFEFWQHREDRLHDRLTYTRDLERGWRMQRLAP